MRTVFIIGAGASYEVELPLGNELPGQIVEVLNFEKHNPENREYHYETRILNDALEAHCRRSPRNSGDYQAYGRKCRTVCGLISRAMPGTKSIDNYIDTRTDDGSREEFELICKLAIICTILKAERDCRLIKRGNPLDTNLNYGNFGNTWFVPFGQLLIENCTVEQLHERLKTVTLIIFNYDRCVEHFLLQYFRDQYHIDDEEAAELLGSMQIFHPYGTVGQLPPMGGDESVTFGASVGFDELLELVGQIKTFSEGTDKSSSNIVPIHDSIADADHLVFLGFAFHKMNLELLTPITFPPSRESRHPIFLGTALGVPDTETPLIIKNLRPIAGVFDPTFQLKDLDCRQFFDKSPQILGKFFE